MKTNLFINPHLGLGDFIIINGMIRHFAKQYKKVVVTVWPHYRKEIESMFSDLDNFQTITASSDGKDTKDIKENLNNWDYDYLDLGNNGKDFSSYSNFADGFYKQANLDYEISYSEFKIPLENRYKISFCNYFIHDDMLRGYEIVMDSIEEKWVRSPEFSIMPDIDSNKTLDYWIPFIKGANEIHVIDSCFLHLADRVPTTGKLVLHRYTRPTDSFHHVPLKKDWNIIK